MLIKKVSVRQKSDILQKEKCFGNSMEEEKNYWSGVEASGEGMVEDSVGDG